jgi:hypothetical protein
MGWCQASQRRRTKHQCIVLVERMRGVISNTYSHRVLSICCRHGPDLVRGRQFTLRRCHQLCVGCRAAHGDRSSKTGAKRLVCNTFGRELYVGDEKQRRGAFDSPRTASQVDDERFDPPRVEDLSERESQATCPRFPCGVFVDEMVEAPTSPSNSLADIRA